ncbi:MAG: metalloregulator ArsR/SmtB family transcription factor [Candidatus Marinimicrobia bacterium]|nr:metalloregulator ArsR/SmtB family transcription factor [Candidatus Neomarinimicrobiota bacterium]
MSVDYKTLERKADILKAIAHPVRLAMLKGLMKNGPTRVMDMETGIKVNPATVSQHLNKCKNVNIVTRERKGVEIYYSIRNVEGVATMLDVFLS